MSTFKYRVLTRGSAVLEGKRASVSKGELIDYLKKSGHIVLKVEEVGGAKTSRIFSDRSVKKATVFFTGTRNITRKRCLTGQKSQDTFRCTGE